MTLDNPPKRLSEAFGDNCVFSFFSENVPWYESLYSEISSLDLDYLYNHSGRKKCSPLVYHLLGENETLSNADCLRLAGLIEAKYLANWTALWRTYHAQYDPLSDTSISESGTDTEGISGTKSGSKTGSNTGTDNLSIAHGEQVSGSDALAHGESVAGSDSLLHGETVTGSDALTHGETIGIQQSANSTENDSKYGFNSGEAVPTDKRTNTATLTETDQHSGVDSRATSEAHTGTDTRTTSETHSGTDTHTTSEIHSGTDQHNRTLNLANGETTSETNSQTNTGSFQKSRTGRSGVHTVQEIIQRERELWLEDFFSRVYTDIDSVLCDTVYLRKHRRKRVFYGYGYYYI